MVSVEGEYTQFHLYYVETRNQCNICGRLCSSVPGGGATADKSDVEKGAGATSAKEENRPPTDEIIPVYRRDCHGEVYCGSHMYPGRGVYLLKFDNSYSLWRSKTLYYRVYYTR